MPTFVKVFTHGGRAVSYRNVNDIHKIIPRADGEFDVLLIYPDKDSEKCIVYSKDLALPIPLTAISTDVISEEE